MKGFKIIRTKDGKKIKRDLDITSFVYDSEVIRNNIEAVCQVLRGELNYNSDLGIQLGLDKTESDLTISRLILGVYGVKKIKSFESILEGRHYTANIVVETVFNEEVGVNI